MKRPGRRKRRTAWPDRPGTPAARPSARLHQLGCNTVRPLGFHSRSQTMQYTIEQASDLGGVIRDARNVQKWRRNDAAGTEAHG